MSMIHIDGQQIAVYAIVGVASLSLLRRLTAQAMAFRSKSDDTTSPCGGCGGCAAAKANELKAVPLVQLQLTAPKRIQRPSAE